MENTCYLYLRVSTDEQAKQGFSLDNQRRACGDYAKSNGYQIIDTFLEEGRSARTTDRPEFQKLLKAVDDKPVNAIIVYKIDRFARNVSDFSNIRKELKSKGINLISLSEGGDVTEGLIGNIFASVAEWESEVNGNRTRDALAQKYRNGWWPGWAPLGYQNVQKGDKKIVVPHPKTALQIKEMFRLYSTGYYSLLELCRVMYEKGLTARQGKMLSDSSTQQILTNTFYYGLMKWNGKEKRGNHKPIISKALFDQCQYVLAKNRMFLIRKRKYNFLLRGFVFCKEHKRRLTAEWHFYNNDRYKKDKIGYYHCTTPRCKDTYIEVNRLEKLVANQIKKFEFSPEFIELVKQHVKSHLEENRSNIQSQKQEIINKKKAIEAKRDKLEDLIVEGTIDREIFKRQHSQLQEKINQLDNQTLDLEAKHQIDVNLIDEVLALTRNINKTYNEAPEFLKRHYLRFFFEGIYIKDRKIVKVAETPVLSALKKEHYIIISRNRLLG